MLFLSFFCLLFLMTSYVVAYKQMGDKNMLFPLLLAAIPWAYLLGEILFILFS